MSMTGGCYCGAIRYDSTGAPVMKSQCHCRECQYISGGGPNYFMILPQEGFSYTAGTPNSFTRPDLDAPVTREFCPNCGTHILTRRPGLDMVILKVGTLDNLSDYGGPDSAIHTLDMQPFHVISEGLPSFEKRPPRR